MRNARQELVIIRILSVSYSHLNVSKPIDSAVDPNLRTGTVSFGSLPLVTLSYLSHSAYFFLYTQIVADSCEWLISYADKYVLLRPLRWMMKPLATVPLEQESESSTIIFLVTDDVLRMPLAYGHRG